MSPLGPVSSLAVDAAALRAVLERRSRESLRIAGFREAAVLVPIVVDPEGAERLLLTVRRDDLPTHAGQIAFPGGKRDPSDQDLFSTALREADEELGIDRASVEILGVLDDVPTPTGFVITPVVGRLAGPLRLVPAAGEVAAVFACELSRLADESRYVDAGTRSFLGISYVMHEYHWEGNRIWGATARIVHQLLALMRAAVDQRIAP